MTLQRWFLPLSIMALAFILTLSSSVRVIRAQTTPSAANINLIELTDTLDKYLQAQGFIPGTIRQGSVYVHNLQNGQTLTINPNVTYSGVSMTKIAILFAFYQMLHGADPRLLVTQEQARLLAKMIVCSDNAAANEILKWLGSGDINLGLEHVSVIFSEVGIRITLNRPYSSIGTPSVTEGPVNPTSADADPTNQAEPEELGKLLAFIYTCAQRTDDPFGNSFIATNDCRHMIQLMRAVHLGALIEAGVPNQILVAHKQGWSEDTHGDAALITTPGGDYILVIALHQRKWLASTASFPVMSEVSRLVYNAYNPNSPLKAIHPQKIPLDCPIELDVLNALKTLLAPPVSEH